MNTKELDKLFGTRTTEEQLDADVNSLVFSFLAIIDRQMEIQNMTKKVLATEIGTSAAYITQLFRGNKRINLETVVKMQNALGIEFEVNLKGASRDSVKKKDSDFLIDAYEEFDRNEIDPLWSADCFQKMSCNANLVA